jgi:hypothetical protein
VYGLKLGLDPGGETSVAQIDLVPTLSLLMGKGQATSLSFLNNCLIPKSPFSPRMVIGIRHTINCKTQQTFVSLVVDPQIFFSKFGSGKKFRILADPDPQHCL